VALPPKGTGHSTELMFLYVVKGRRCQQGVRSLQGDRDHEPPNCFLSCTERDTKKLASRRISLSSVVETGRIEFDRSRRWPPLRIARMAKLRFLTARRCYESLDQAVTWAVIGDRSDAHQGDERAREARLAAISDSCNFTRVGTIRTYLALAGVTRGSWYASRRDWHSVPTHAKWLQTENTGVASCDLALTINGQG
jgi:hypothetical protein